MGAGGVTGVVDSVANARRHIRYRKHPHLGTQYTHCLRTRTLALYGPLYRPHDRKWQRKQLSQLGRPAVRVAVRVAVRLLSLELSLRLSCCPPPCGLPLPPRCPPCCQVGSKEHPVLLRLCSSART